MPLKKNCTFRCGQLIHWDHDIDFWAEEDGTEHSYARCAELLTEQGKPIPFEMKQKLDRKKKAKKDDRQSTL